MKFRTLLLGTAAAFSVAGGAEAADLAVAEAIDYVKVCDAYGAGYSYIPGTDTCLRVGGYVRLDVWFYDTDKVGNIIGQSVSVPDPADLPADVPVATDKDSYASDWEFKTRATVNFTARTMSDLGPVVTHLTLITDSNNNDWVGFTKNVRMDNAYGSIGPLLFGWTNSTFDYGGGFTYDGSFRSDIKADQVRWSYALGSWGLMVGLEDPRDRYTGAKNATGDFPDIVAAITGGAGGWDWKASAAVTDRTSGTGWGAQLGITGNLGGGFKVRAQAAYADNFRSLVGGGNSLDNCTGACDDGAWWSALISAIAPIGGNVSAAATLSYADGPVSGDERWQGAIGAYWAATSTSEIGLEFLYKGFGSAGPDDNWGIHGRFRTFFGG